MVKVIWKDYRKNVNYVVNAAVADLPGIPEEYYKDYKPTFTALPEDHDGLYSLEKLFMEYYRDPTEYQFVANVFESDVKHWEVFKSSRFIAPLYAKWKQKAEAKLLSEAMAKIVDTAFDETNRSSFQALKYLVERNQKSETGAKRGRPKKEKEEPKDNDNMLLEAIKRIQE